MGDERELNGPGSYEQYNQISIICQNRYFKILHFQIILLIAIAALSSFIPLSSQDRWILYIELGLITLVFLSMIIQNSYNYVKGWQNTRFLAESILSNAWLYVWKCEPYAEEKTANREFVGIVGDLETEVDTIPYISLYSSEEPEIAHWMKKFRKEKLAAKKEQYIKFRMDDQINWYSKKATHNQNRSTQGFIVGLSLMGLGAIFTLLILSDYLPNLSFLGFFTTAAASVFSLSQAKRYDQLKVTYGVSAMELRRFKARMDPLTINNELKELVGNIEKAISREHKLWHARAS